jgi:hypothetical protein
MHKIFTPVSALLLVAGAATPASATIFLFKAALSGAAEVPANPSPGTGTAAVTFDNVANTLTVNVTFSGLIGNTVASHIHCCTAVSNTGNTGVATETPSFPLFPTGVTSGSYTDTFNLTLASSYNPAFVTANGGTAASAEAALLAGMLGSKSYLNIHTVAFPGGEIRGFLSSVPEPASWLLMIVGFGAVGAALRIAPKTRRQIV